MLVIRNDTETQDVVANSFEDGKIDLAITRFWICPISINTSPMDSDLKISIN